MEVLVLLVTFLVFICQRGPVDAIHAAKGTTPPRYKVKAAAAARAGTTWTPPAYGTKEWFADLRSDALVANTDWRRRRAAGRAADRQRVEATSTSPTPTAAPALAVTQPVPAAQAAINIPLGDPEATQPVPPMRVGDRSTQPSTPAEKPESTTDNGRLADVIPLFKQFTKESDMSIDVNPEVQGLPQSIAHAELMVEAGNLLGTAGGEAFLAHLNETDNGDDTKDAAAHAQQAFDQAAIAGQALLDLLIAQLQVKEASDAIGGEHGNKDFLNAGE